MKAIVPADSRPKKCLGLEPKIGGLADVDVALWELGWMDSRESTVKEATKQRVDAIKAEAEKELFVTIGRKSVSFADRRKALLSALLEWAKDNRELVLAELDGKTREFTHGTVGYAQQPKCLQFLDEELGEQGLWNLVDELFDSGGLKLWLERKLYKQAVTENKKVRLSHLITLKPSINWAGLKTMAKNGTLTAQDLAALGLEYVRPEDERIDVKPRKYAVESQPSAA